MRNRDSRVYQHMAPATGHLDPGLELANIWPGSSGARTRSVTQAALALGDNQAIESPSYGEQFGRMAFARFKRPTRPVRPGRRRLKAKLRTKRQDPIFVDGQRPRPMYVDYKDLELLSKLTNRQGKIVSRRKTGCSAVSQHAVTRAIKRARFMALLPYVAD